MKNNQLVHSLYRILLGIVVGCFFLGEIAQATVFNVSISFFELSTMFFVLLCIIIGYKDLWSAFLQKNTRIFIPFLMYMGASLVLVYFSLSTRIFLVDLLYTARFLLFFLFYLSIYFGISKKIIITKQVTQFLILFGFGIAILGLLQYIFIPDTRFLFTLGWDEHYLRVISTLLDPPFTGAIIAVAVLVFHQKRISVQWFFGLLVLLSSLLLTYSRASYVALAVALVFLLITKKKTQTVITLILFLVCIPFLPRPASEGTRLERVASIDARNVEFQKTIHELRPSTFVYGNGWYVTKAGRQAQNGISTSHSSAPDNSYLHILESFGILGILPLLYVLFHVLKSYKNMTGYSIFLLICLASIVNNVLFYPWVMAILWLTYVLTKPTEDM